MFIMPQGGAVDCTYKHSTACATDAVSCASRCSKSAGRTCGGGTAVRTHAHEHVACMSFSIMNATQQHAYGMANSMMWHDVGWHEQFE